MTEDENRLLHDSGICHVRCNVDANRMLSDSMQLLIIFIITRCLLRWDPLCGWTGSSDVWARVFYRGWNVSLVDLSDIGESSSNIVWPE